MDLTVLVRCDQTTEESGIGYLVMAASDALDELNEDLVRIQVEIHIPKDITVYEYSTVHVCISNLGGAKTMKRGKCIEKGATLLLRC